MWNTCALWWGLSYACKDNQLPQCPPTSPLQFSTIPLQTTSNTLFRWTWKPRTGTIYFGKCLSPGQIKHAVTRWCSTSFQLTSNSAWIGVMEIARFIEDVHMPGDHIRQTWHLLISACRDIVRSWCNSRNCTHNMNSKRALWQWCSCMKHPQTHMESNMFHFKQGWLRIVNAVNHFKQQAN